MMMIQVNVEPGITIGFLNRLLVAEGLSLAVVPEVFHDGDRYRMLMMKLLGDDGVSDDHSQSS